MAQPVGENLARALGQEHVTIMAGKLTMEIVEGPLEVGKPSRPRWRMVKRSGEWVRVRVLDPDSPTFDADLLAAFRWNVRRVKAEQRKRDAAEREGV